MSGEWRPGYRHVFAVIAAVASLYFGVRTSQAVVENRTLARQVQDQRSAVRTLEQQNAALEAELAYEHTPAYVERVARLQLGLQKPGDHVVQVRTAAPTAQDTHPPAADAQTPRRTPAVPYWRRWLQLFAQPVPVGPPALRAP